MASLFYVARRPSKPVYQEISQALFSTFEILRRVHGSQVSKQPEDPPEPHRIEGKVENTA